MAKLCEVLKCHLLQKWHDLVQASAKDLVFLEYSSDATSLKCHVQVRASVKKHGSQRQGFGSIFSAKRFCEIHRIIGKRV